MTERLRRLPRSVVVTMVALLVTAGPASSQSAPDVAAHAALAGVDISTAEREIELTDLAGALQERLESLFPDDFGGLWIDRVGGFRFAVATTRNRDAEIIRLAPEELRAHLTFRRVGLSLRELLNLSESAGQALDVPANRNVDITRNEVTVEVRDADAQAAALSLMALSDVRLRLVPVPDLGGPSATMYGGLALGSTIGKNGTSGFTVRQTIGGVDGMLTAGHLSDSLTYPGVVLDFQAQLVADYADAQWHTTPGTIDQPKFHVGGGVTRDVLAKKTHSQVVVGQSLCKYGKSTGHDCGTVESKNYAPSWVQGGDSVFIVLKSCGTDMSSDGDSGGPSYFNTTAYGIISGWTWGGIGCTDKAIINAQNHAVAPFIGLTVLLA